MRSEPDERSPGWTPDTRSSATGPEFRNLDPEACRLVLSRNHVGRIGHAMGRTIEILPVYYAYAEGWIYGRMRRSRKRGMLGWYGWWPAVFQVDEVEDLFHWRTVHVRGGLYALPADGTEEERETRRHAIELLRELIPQTFRRNDPMPSHTGVFRISVQEIDGSEALPEDERKGEESPQPPERNRTAPRRGPRQPRPYPDPVDDTLDDSFPASDPPSWSGK